MDLRRAIAARPWNFPWLCARSVVSHLPLSVLRLFPGLAAAAYRRHLRLNTTGDFARGPAFEEALLLRLTSAQISNAQQAIVRTNRLLTAAVSERWLSMRVTAPTLIVQPPQRAWRHLARRSRERVAGPVEVAHVPGTRNLPQLENPTGFVDAVADFAGKYS